MGSNSSTCSTFGLPSLLFSTYEYKRGRSAISLSLRSQLGRSTRFLREPSIDGVMFFTTPLTGGHKWEMAAGPKADSSIALEGCTPESLRVRKMKEGRSIPATTLPGKPPASFHSPAIFKRNNDKSLDSCMDQPSSRQAYRSGPPFTPLRR